MNLQLKLLKQDFLVFPIETYNWNSLRGSLKMYKSFSHTNSPSYDYYTTHFILAIEKV